MLGKLFGKPRDEGASNSAAMSGSSNGSTLQTLERLQETIEMLEKRQNLLEKKVRLASTHHSAVPPSDLCLPCAMYAHSGIH